MPGLGQGPFRKAALVVAVFGLAGACKARQAPGPSATLADADADPIGAISGCYPVERMDVDGPLPDPTIAEQMRRGAELCILDTRQRRGARNSMLEVTINDPQRRVIGGPWGFDFHPGAVRRSGSYMFVGIDGSFDWDGAENLANPAIPVMITAEIAQLTLRVAVRRSGEALPPVDIP